MPTQKSENFSDSKVETESSPMPQLDAMGREKFWEDLGRPND